MHSILSSFLTAGLLPIGEDDEKLNLLEAAANDLSGQFTHTPSLVYRFALVGFDDRTRMSDPVVAMAATAVIGKWNTITNKIGAEPIQVYRAVILRAIELAGAEHPSIKRAVGLISQNQPALHSSGKERDAVLSMLQQFNMGAAGEEEDAWVNAVKIDLPKAKFKKTQLGKDELTAGLGRAAGPNDKGGKGYSAANPHWPDSGQPWSHEFVVRAADAIHAAIQISSRGVAEEIQESVQQGMQDLLSGINRLAVRDAKAELLWIRTSMFSPLARKGYRELDPADVVFHAAVDVSRVVATIAPPSVEFFLRDLVSPLAKKKLKLSDLLAEIGPKLEVLPEASSIFGDTLPASGRRTWLDIAIRPNRTVDFAEQAGVPADHEESSADLAVKIYREIQVRKLLSTTAV